MLSHEKKQIEAQLQALSSEHIDGGQMKAQIDHLLEQLSELPILREELAQSAQLKQIQEATIKQLESQLREAAATASSSAQKTAEDNSSNETLRSEVNQLKDENSRLSANVAQLEEQQRNWDTQRRELSDTILTLQQQIEQHPHLQKEKADADVLIQHLRIELTQNVSKYNADRQISED